MIQLIDAKLIISYAVDGPREFHLQLQLKGCVE